MFPETDRSLATEDHGFPKLFLAKALENTDKRLAEGKTVVPYFLLAAFLWEPVRSKVAKKMEQGVSEAIAYQEAASEVISKQVQSTSFPKRVGLSMREVWSMQSAFNRRSGARPYRLLAHPRFRAAYDFLLLRAETGGADQESADWWTQFQFADEAEQKQMPRPPRKSQKNRRMRRRSGQSRSTSPSVNTDG